MVAVPETAPFALYAHTEGVPSVDFYLNRTSAPMYEAMQFVL
jgi:hypothetical protein